MLLIIITSLISDIHSFLQSILTFYRINALSQSNNGCTFYLQVDISLINQRLFFINYENLSKHNYKINYFHYLFFFFLLFSVFQKSFQNTRDFIFTFCIFPVFLSLMCSFFIYNCANCVKL